MSNRNFIPDHSNTIVRVTGELQTQRANDRQKSGRVTESIITYQGKASQPVRQPSSRKSSRDVGGKSREVGGPHPSKVLSLKIGSGIELNRNVTCMVLKAAANDRRTSQGPCHDEFRGPRSGTVEIRCHKKQHINPIVILQGLPK
ncbi:hypothetical protein TNCV_2617911 [Trichonephila clavipes]|nr:hypothetical protein TNCV_2617911 [Trichonephila clavipes]